MVEGFVPMLEFGDLIFKLFWMNAIFGFRQCGDVIIYVFLHYLYSDIIVVWIFDWNLGNMIYNGLITL